MSFTNHDCKMPDESQTRRVRSQPSIITSNIDIRLYLYEEITLLFVTCIFEMCCWGLVAGIYQQKLVTQAPVQWSHFININQIVISSDDPDSQHSHWTKHCQAQAQVQFLARQVPKPPQSTLLEDLSKSKKVQILALP